MKWTYCDLGDCGHPHTLWDSLLEREARQDLIKAIEAWLKEFER